MIEDSSEDIQAGSRIIVWSDTHISKFTGVFHEECFETGIGEIVDILYKDPNAIVLHLGDVSDSGTFEDYVFSKQKIKETFAAKGLIPKIHYLPGNHDMRNIGYELWKDFYGERYIFIDTTEKGGNVVILGIDSSEPDVNTGRIGDRGIEGIFSRLAHYPDDVTKICCFHHHLIPIPNTGRERSTILDAGDVRQVLWDAGVDILITAHKHSPNVYTLSNGSRKLLLVNSGTFSSYKTRGMAGHTFVELFIRGKEFQQNNIEIKFHGLDQYSQFQSGDNYIFEFVNGEIPVPQTQINDNLIAKICHFSDTHFSTSSDFQPKIYDTGISLMLQENPNLILHSGDLTRDGYPEDYAMAKHKMKELKETNIPFIIIPGIRDLQPFGREMWISEIGPLDPILDTDIVRVMGVNTGPEDSGAIGRTRLKMIEEDFKEYGDKRLFLVLMHHSILPIPKASYNRGIKDGGAALSALAGKIPLIISGFEHFSNTIQVENTVFVNAGTFSSKMVKSKRMNTFNVLSVYSTGTIQVEEIEIHSGRRRSHGCYRLLMPRLKQNSKSSKKTGQKTRKTTRKRSKKK